jgi:formylglycine-generating enzyme required for sulfatase activity
MYDYLDFELEINSDPKGGYGIAVVKSPAGEAFETVAFPYDEATLESKLKDVQIALLRSGSKQRRVLTEEEQAVREFGQALFEFLLYGEVASLYRESQREAAQQAKGVRLKLRIQPPELAALPWEFLFDPRNDEFVCLSSSTPIVRYLPAANPPRPLPMQPPLRILAILANFDDLAPIDVAQEKQRMDAAVDGLRARGLVELAWYEDLTWRDLQRVLRQNIWHVFHFTGHGGFDSELDEGYVVLADEQGDARKLTATHVGRLLADQHFLRLVVLNACDGARGSQIDVFSSTAATLVRRGMPAVVSMQTEISDQAAIEFARSFYDALAETLPVDVALSEARKAMSLTSSNSVEWATPVLYMRSPDGRLFEFDEGEASSSAPSLQTPAQGKTIPFTAGILRTNGTADAVQLRAALRFDWVTIPAGEFLMGSDPDTDLRAHEDEFPQHTVFLPAFRIARAPVTNAQYKVFTDATQYRMPDHWEDGSIPEGKENHPVTFVSWYDAKAFCEWAGLRLLTEAEWEKAARGTDGRLYPWGNELPDRKRCNFNNNEQGTTPVYQYADGASPFGVLDMAGNVLEWTDSLYLNYPFQAERAPEVLRSDEPRVLRGGTYGYHPDLVWHVRCAGRFTFPPNHRAGDIGFRVAID